LAGGLNLYGFAGGDPVNYSDPFGLDPCTAEQTENGWSDVTSDDGGAECQSGQSLPAVTITADASTGSCIGAAAGMAGSVALDVGLALSYGTGAGLLARGTALALQGVAIRQGLVLTTTLASAGSTGAAEVAAGAVFATAGASAIGMSALALPVGISFAPGGNSYNFIKQGGLSACDR
jgi:hypothetical protein